MAEMTNLRRVFLLLWDGRWHPASELIRVGTHRFAEYVRQLRSEHGLGDLLVTERHPDGKWYYKITEPDRIDFHDMKPKPVPPVVAGETIPLL